MNTKTGQRSLVGQPWVGRCLLHPENEMFLNTSGHWECPDCGLQVRLREGAAEVLAQRGIADFYSPTPGGSRQSALDVRSMQWGKITHDLRFDQQEAV